MSNITEILHAIDRGDPRASSELLPLVYAELRSMAEQRMHRERSGHTLQATALVHDAYLRLVQPGPDGQGPKWDGRRHFFAAAAEAMRRILIDHARTTGARKRGGGAMRLSLDACEQFETDPEALLDLDDALERLSEAEPQKAELVKLRFFAGLTLSQAAEALGVSRATASRQWAYARAWLFAAMNPQSPDGGSQPPR